MRFLSRKKELPIVPTVGEHFAMEAVPNVDPEAHASAVQIEGNIPQDEIFRITPEMEKKVVRKLDKRLVPLVMGLCKIFPSN